MAPSDPEMSVALACRAFDDSLCIKLGYGGRTRLVEVHAVGHSAENHTLMLVWQVSGGSASGTSSGWKLLRLDAVQSATLTRDHSKAPRPGFKRGEPAMKGGIIREI